MTTTSATPQKPGTPVQKPAGPTHPPAKPIHRTPKQPPAKPGAELVAHDGGEKPPPGGPPPPPPVPFDREAVLDLLAAELSAALVRLNARSVDGRAVLAGRLARLGGDFTLPEPVGPPRFVEGEHRLVGGVHSGREVRRG